jgi:hypothetical protein
MRELTPSFSVAGSIAAIGNNEGIVGVVPVVDL